MDTTYLKAITRALEFATALLEPCAVTLKSNGDLINRKAAATIRDIVKATLEVLIQQWPHFV